MIKQIFSAKELRKLGFEPYSEGGVKYYGFKFNKEIQQYPELITTDGEDDDSTEQFLVYLADYRTLPVFKDHYLTEPEINSLISIYAK